jgi:Zn-dependent M16 (insulinase) family peptidase
MVHSARRFQPALRIEELWKGLDQVIFLHTLTEDLKTIKPELPALLRILTDHVIRASEAEVNVTAEPDTLEDARERVEDFIHSLHGRVSGRYSDSSQVGMNEAMALLESSLKGPFFPSALIPKGERIAISSAVGFAASACRGSWIGGREQAEESLLAHLMKTGYLWEQIRMKGGAYGVSASANGTEGLFTFSSYRDPKSGETPGVFRSALENVSTSELSERSLERALIGTVGKELKPLAPGIKGFVGFRRRLYSITDENRQSRRDWMLRTSPRNIRDAAERLAVELTYGNTVILAGLDYLNGLTGDSPVVKLPV